LIEEHLLPEESSESDEIDEIENENPDIESEDNNSVKE